MPAPTLYLIDGYAQFFRAYHAIRTPMSSPVTKEPTNMTFGFLGMLFKLLRGEGKAGERQSSNAQSSKSETASFAGAAASRPSGSLLSGPLPSGTSPIAPIHVAVCLDVSGDRGTFRSQLYPEYKATRSEPPEDLFPQVDRCLKALEAIGVPTIGAEGFEADDCIATLVTALRRAHPDLRIRIISKDKDLKQLLTNDHVEIYDIHTDELTTQAKLREEIGIEPAQVIDMLALMGDTVDNVPGVEGVGPKTAAKLIAEHGTLEGVLNAARAGKIKGKVGEKIAAAAALPDWGGLKLSHELVTLRHDVPVTLDLTAADARRLNLAPLIPILKELGFNRYQDEVRALMGESRLGEAKGQAKGQSAKPDARQSDASAPSSATEPGLFGAPGAAASAPSNRAAKPGASTAGTTDAPTGFATLFDAPSSGAAAVVSGSHEFGAMTSIKAESGEYRCIRTLDELRGVVEAIRATLAADPDACLAIDTETTGLSPLTCKLCGVSLSWTPGTGVYIPVRSPEPTTHANEREVLDVLRPLLEDPRVPKCGHNLKYDMLVLRQAGPQVAGFAPSPNGEQAGRVVDSMVASYLIDATRSSHGLDALSLSLLGRTNISIKELIGSGGAGKEQRTFDMVPLNAATEYAAEDADASLQLRNAMLPQLREMGLQRLFERMEMPLVEVLAELEFNGIRVDRSELDRQSGRLQARIAELRKEIDREAMQKLGRTFNPDSPRQLAAALFNKPTDEFDPDDAISSGPGLGLKPIKRIKTGYSTDAEVLETLALDPEISTNIPSLIVEHRELSKLVGTYLVALAEAINPATGRVHSSFNQTVAVTGRLASSDPNLQNIPIRTDVGREIRRAFIAPEGRVLVSADYSQIELRLLAHLSRDPALIEAFDQGEDIHTTVAAQIAGITPSEVTKAQRSAAKMVNFGIVYGITPFGLARRLGVSNAQASEIIDGYKRRFAGITTFLQECVEQARGAGYVETMLGRRRMIPEIHSNIPARKALAERTAINTVVQGSAADLIKLAMVEMHRLMQANIRGEPARGMNTATNSTPSAPASMRMLLQIHDELVFECDQADAEAARAFMVHHMEHAVESWRFDDGRTLDLRVPIRVDASIAANWFDGK